MGHEKAMKKKIRLLKQSAAIIIVGALMFSAILPPFAEARLRQGFHPHSSYSGQEGGQSRAYRSQESHHLRKALISMDQEAAQETAKRIARENALQKEKTTLDLQWNPIELKRL